MKYLREKTSRGKTSQKLWGIYSLTCRGLVVLLGSSHYIVNPVVNVWRCVASSPPPFPTWQPVGKILIPHQTLNAQQITHSSLLSGTQSRKPFFATTPSFTCSWGLYEGLCDGTFTLCSAKGSGLRDKEVNHSDMGQCAESGSREQQPWDRAMVPTSRCKKEEESQMNSIFLSTNVASCSSSPLSHSASHVPP